jgi:Protein of unknown function (DUF2281)
VGAYRHLICAVARAILLTDMSTAEMLFEKAKHLPENLQAEALHYVDFLLSRRAAEKEDQEWSTFSATQLANQYSLDGAIYDD